MSMLGLRAVGREMRTRLVCVVLPALIPTVAVAIGDVWRQTAPLPSAGSLNAVLYNGSQWVAVGQRGSLLTSTDASNWTPRTLPTTANLRGVAWSGSLFVVAGENAVLLSSSDAVNWTLQPSPLQINWRSVVWSGSLFVAAGDNGVAATSPDGAVWTARYTGSGYDWQGCASSAGGQFVVVGSQGGIATSSNGSTWSTPVLPSAKTLRSVACNSAGSQWVAVGDAGTIETSTNLTTWSLASSGVSGRLNQVFWDGGQFVALGDDGVCLTSSDGQLWTSRSTGVTVALKGGASTSGLLVAVGMWGSIVTTTDVSGSWTLQSGNQREFVQDVIWTGSQFVAVGSSGQVATSPDGNTWTAQSSGVSDSLNGVAWTGTRLVAVGNGGRIVTSPDGVSWTARTSGTAQALLGIAYTGSKLVAVGRNGTVITSSDGTSWSAATSGTTAALLAVAAGGGQIIAVGVGGVIITSSTATSWSKRTSGVTDDLTCVATNGTITIAGGETGVLLKSSNLSTWQSQSVPFSGLQTSALHGLRWLGAEFVALGHQGSFSQPLGFLMDSLDGASWVFRRKPVTPSLKSVATGPQQAVAVGESGVMISNDLSVLPTAQISSSSLSVPESAGVQTFTVTLSSPAPGTILVPIRVSGSATPNVDAKVSSTLLTFSLGQTTATFTVTILQDTIDEPDETLMFTLDPPLGAGLGTVSSVQLTIVDDDFPPAITSDPVGDIVIAGTSVSFSASAVGATPLTLQWLKDGVLIKGAASPTLTLPSATIALAGDYLMRATNPSGHADSAIAELGVVDNTSKTLAFLEGQTVTMTINAGGKTSRISGGAME